MTDAESAGASSLVASGGIVPRMLGAPVICGSKGCAGDHANDDRVRPVETEQARVGEISDATLAVFSPMLRESQRANAS
jgi:hypothetical protein